jgi:CDP-paratose synthetase
VKILITGGTGFLGSHIATSLSGGESKIAILSRKKTDESRRKIKSASYITARYGNNSDIQRFIKEFGPDVVIHTAGAYGRSNEGLMDVYDANIHYGMTLLQCLLTINKKVVFLNAGTSLPSNLSSYALSKNQFTDWGRLFTELHPNNLQFLNLKLQRFYGPGDYGDKFTAKIINACKNNEEFIDLTPGNQQVDFIYIDDVLSAFHLVLSQKKHLPNYLDVPVGSGTATSVKKFAEMAREISKSSIKLNFGKLSYRENEPMESVADITVLRNLGWKSFIDTKTGLTRSLKQGIKS